MIAHKAIEIINTSLKTDLFNSSVITYLKQVKNDLTNAIKFEADYDSLPEKGDITYFQLPFQLCYYEFNYGQGSTLGLILRQINERLISIDMIRSTAYGYEPQFITLNIHKREKGIYMEVTELYPEVTQIKEELKALCEHAVSDASSFTQIINCSNITYAEHKAPKSLNKKRQKKGKQPLFSFKTLEIDCNHSADARIILRNQISLN